MKIFDKRPVCLILCIMLGSFAFFEYFGLYSLIIPAIILILSFIKPIFRFIKSSFLIILAALSILSITLSFIYFDLWYDAAKRYNLKESTVTCTVTDMEPTGAYRALEVKCDNINNTLLSDYKLIVNVNTNEYQNLSIGSKIKIKGVIEESINPKFSGKISEIEELEIVKIGDFTTEYKISSYRKAISRRLIMSTNKEVGGLLSALLFGEKEYLSPQIKLDFKRLGLSHILALSGMHLAILAVGFSKLLMLIGINKKSATVCTVLFTVAYMAFTGFSVSVTRAGLMLIISSVLFLISSSHDSMTSLFLSVFLIVLFDPNAINDLALWLSAFATLGIIVMNEWLSQHYRKPSFLWWILVSLLSSFFAIAATSFITVLKFDGISLFAPITTLIFSFLTELFIYTGIILLFIGNLMPFNFLTTALGNLIIKLSSSLSELDFVYSATNFISVKIFIVIFSLLFLAFLILKIKKKKLYLSSLAILLVFIFSMSLILTVERENKKSLSYYNYDTESFISTDSGNINIIDIGSYDEYSSYYISSILANENLTKIDNYIFTNYSYTLSESADVIMGSFKTENIYIPAPKNEDELEILYEILSLISEFRTKLFLYKEGETLDFENLKFSHHHNASLGNGKGTLVSLEFEEKTHTYASMSLLEKRATKNMALELIAKCDTIILGRHGSYKDDFKIYIPSAKAIIFSERKMINTESLLYYKSARIYSEPRKVNLIR